MKNPELIFIPTPGMGHLIAAVEAAKLLVDLDDRLSITVLKIKPTYDSKVSGYVQSLEASTSFSDRIRFIDLPQPPQDELAAKNLPPHKFFTTYIESHKPLVKDAVLTRFDDSDSVLAGFIIDMFCTPMIDLATEFGVPSYVFFTTNLAFLALMFHLQTQRDEQNMDTSELSDSDSELHFPGFVNPIPAKVLPTVVVDKDFTPVILDIARRFRETKGIMVNSFMEIESLPLEFLSQSQVGNIPPIFPVGPILNLKGDGHDESSSGEFDVIMQWLDNQPPSSVVFLCFGSMGSFSEDQVQEIACALEQSGHRFLWSLRKPQAKGVMSSPTDYSNFEEVLPEGFLERTAEVGKVIGWAPQVSVLAHPAIGGFVSHCGWNSTLESIWFGVPIAVWPLYAEQQFNAFQMVRELGLAVEIKMDYKSDSRLGIKEPPIVTAEEIKRGIVGLMEPQSDVRKKMKVISEKCRKASVKGGGSSYSSLRDFISLVLGNMP
ncbi:hypothetical protein SLE2022_163750 [Rubroshorea leprosula]